MNAPHDSAASFPTHAASLPSNEVPDARELRILADSQRGDGADGGDVIADDPPSADGQRPSEQTDAPTAECDVPGEDFDDRSDDNFRVIEVPDSGWQPRSRHDPQPTLADTARRGVPWLWPGRIALGRVTLLVGDPGVGKSLVALDIAARVSTGRPWPGDCPEFVQSAQQIGTVPFAPHAEPIHDARMTTDDQ
jgi:hypothetical protein